MSGDSRENDRTHGILVRKASLHSNPSVSRVEEGRKSRRVSDPVPRIPLPPTEDGDLGSSHVLSPKSPEDAARINAMGEAIGRTRKMSLTGIENVNGHRYTVDGQKYDAVIILMPVNPAALEKLVNEPHKYIGKKKEVQAKSADKASLEPYTKDPEIIDAVAALIPEKQTLFAKAGAVHGEESSLNLQHLLTREDAKYDLVPVKDKSGKRTLYIEYTDASMKKVSGLKFMTPEEVKQKQGYREAFRALQDDGKFVISDNDLELIARSFTTLRRPLSDLKLGNFHPDELDVLKALKKSSHKMLFHAGQNHNPYGFEPDVISKDQRQLALTPDGAAHSITSEAELLAFCNTWRKKGYNITLNPLAGYNVNEKGDLFREARPVDYRAAHKEIGNIVNITQQDNAKSIMELKIRIAEMKMSLPVVEIQAEKAKKHELQASPVRYAATIGQLTEQAKGMTDAYRKWYGKADPVTCQEQLTKKRTWAEIVGSKLSHKKRLEPEQPQGLWAMSREAFTKFNADEVMRGRST